jgi:PHP family Zn ribbon phosphoesterase
MLIADLHIHSRYSMATSPALTPQLLDLWARKKGIGLLGTGDITHPLWRTELQEKLEIAQDGFFTVRTRHRLEGETAKPIGGVRFVLSGEVSCIYRKNGKVRKVHNLILFPGFEAAERFSEELEARGCNWGRTAGRLWAWTARRCWRWRGGFGRGAFYSGTYWTPHFSLLGKRADLTIFGML